MIFCESAGPVCKQAFNDTPFDLQYASYTILSLAVSLSLLITAG